MPSKDPDERRRVGRESAARRRAADPERARAYARDYYARTREASARRRLGSQIKIRYGITLDEYYRILAQGCAICGTTEDMVLDHDDKTNQIRGPLCRWCNVGIGHLRHDPILLLAAVQYLDPS